MSTPNSSVVPERKVGAGALAGAFTVLVVFLLREFADLQLSGEVASAITTMATFGVAYYVPNA
jgi:hypothetical protein